MLEEYTTLREQIDNKTRGRKNEVMVCNSPELWASRDGADIIVRIKHTNRVARLQPNNSLTITFGCWHTKLTLKIISALAGRGHYGGIIYKGYVWFEGMPTDGGELEFDARRRYIPPQRFVKLEEQLFNRCAAVTVEKMSPVMRMRFELREKDPLPVLTGAVIDYALGRVGLDKLGLRDMWTCMHHPNAVIQRCFEEVI